MLNSMLYFFFHIIYLIKLTFIQYPVHINWARLPSSMNCPKRGGQRLISFFCPLSSSKYNREIDM